MPWRLLLLELLCVVPPLLIGVIYGTGRINSTSSKYIASTANATVVVLKFLINEDEFHEPQTFRCKARFCMSNVVSVRKYGEYKSGTHVYNRIVSCAAGHA